MGLNSNDKHNAEYAIKYQTVAREEALYNQPQMLLHLKSKQFYLTSRIRTIGRISFSLNLGNGMFEVLS